jgi:protein-S-isoprenylcysteine O-methyltransferase Ste14
MGWINRRELSLRGEFGQKYSEFQQKTWCLIPGTAYGAAKQTVVDKWNADN